MGLDQSVYKMKPSAMISPLAFNEEDPSVSELMYWRKYWTLQGYMYELAERNGYNKLKGWDDSFNDVPILLSPKMINSLFHAIDYLTAEEVCDSIDTPLREKMLLYQFISKAYKALEDGYVLYYMGDY